MSEAPKPPNFESAGRKFLIDRESAYFRAVRFAGNPVKYFAEFRQRLRDEGFEDAVLGTEAMTELTELEVTIAEEGIPIVDDRITELFGMDYETEEWARNVFLILKEAGFTKEQLRVWFEEPSDTATTEERISERKTLFYLNEVFRDS